MRARAATWVLLCARVVCTMPRGVHKRSELRNVCHSRRWSRVRRKKNSAVPGFRHTFGAATAASEANGKATQASHGHNGRSHSQPKAQPQPQPLLDPCKPGGSSGRVGSTCMYPAARKRLRKMACSKPSGFTGKCLVNAGKPHAFPW